MSDPTLAKKYKYKIKVCEQIQKQMAVQGGKISVLDTPCYVGNDNLMNNIVIK